MAQREPQQWHQQHQHQWQRRSLSPRSLLSPALEDVLAAKRVSVRTEARHPESGFAFPANVHLLSQFHRLPFYASWGRLERLLHRRLVDYSLVTGTPLGDFDLVVGILTGGALLAPVAAKLLEVECAETPIRVSRYADDVYTPAGILRVAVAQLFGRHEAQYRLTKAPEPSLLRGRRVLLLDDALASGGTLRAARAFCLEAGVSSVSGVALKVIGGYWDPQDDGHRPPAKELRLPAFTPWGTF